MSADHETHMVNYTVKELLARLDLKIDKIQEGVAEGAKASELNALRDRVTILETRQGERNRSLVVTISVVQVLVAAAAIIISAYISTH